MKIARLFILLVCSCGVCQISCRKSAPSEPAPFVAGVSITSPQDYAAVIDSLVIQVSVASEKSISSVELTIDGKTDSSQILRTPPYRFLWLSPDEPDSSLHTFQAIARQSDNAVLTSAPLRVVVRSFAPSALRMVSATETSMNLAWQDNCKFETGFIIERSVQNGAFAVVDSAGPNTGARTMPGPFVANQNYALRVRAVAPGKASKYSNVVNANIWFSRPAIVQFKSTTDSTILVTWRDSSQLAVKFELERSTDGATFTLAQTVDSTFSYLGEVFGVIREPLTMNQMYYFRVRGVSLYNRSPWSPVVSTTPHFGPPSPPRLLSATNSSVSLAWDGSGRFANDVRVERSAQNGAFVEIGRVDARTTVYTDSSLDQKAGYRYRLRASNGSDFSDYTETLGILFAGTGNYSLSKTLVGAGGLATHVSFTAGDADVVSNAGPTGPIVWDLGTGTILHTFVCRPTVFAEPPALSTTDSYIAMSDGADTVRVFNARTWTPVSTWHAGDGNLITDMAISPDEKSIALVTIGMLFVYRFPTGEFLYSAYPGQYGVSFSPDSRYIATGTFQQVAALFDAGSGNRITWFQCSYYTGVRCVQFSPDGARLAVGGDEGSLYVWRIGDEQLLTRVYCGGNVYGLGFSPDGNAIATSGFFDTLKIWKSNGTVQQIPQYANAGALGFNHDGTRLACGLIDGRVNLYQSSGIWQITAAPGAAGKARTRNARAGTPVR